MTVTDIIRDSVAKFEDSIFVRATDIDANIEVADVEAEGKTVFIFNNLPTITNSALGGVVASYPIQIQIIQLADFDDNTEQGDEIRGRLIPVATKLFNTLQADSRHSRAEYAETFVTDPQGVVKIYDTSYIGVMLEFDFFINVTDLCSA